MPSQLTYKVGGARPRLARGITLGGLSGGVMMSAGGRGIADNGGNGIEDTGVGAGVAALGFSYLTMTRSKMSYFASS